MTRYARPARLPRLADLRPPRKCFNWSSWTSEPMAGRPLGALTDVLGEPICREHLDALPSDSEI